MSDFVHGRHPPKASCGFFANKWSRQVGSGRVDAMPHLRLPDSRKEAQDCSAIGAHFAGSREDSAANPAAAALGKTDRTGPRGELEIDRSSSVALGDARCEGSIAY